jgi:Swt1-like HEPN
MALEQQQRDNLSKALGLFIEAFRPYIVSLLIKEYGEYWPAEFAKNLSSDQLKTWNENLKLGKEPSGLIDYMHFKFFAIKNKELLKPDFDKKTNDIPAWLGEITEVRHKIAHYDNTLEEDEATKAWIHMKTIAKAINMPELETALKSLQTGSIETQVINQAPKATKSNAAHPWFLTVTPHLDIRQGKLDESVFAANLAEVALGNGREIYNNPTVFFSKTYFTAGLKNVAKTG